MKARALERRIARLQTVIATVAELRRAADGRHLADAHRALRAELELCAEELAPLRCPQRARRTRNGTAEEWAEVRQAVRGLDEDQLLLGGGRVADMVAARAAEIRQRRTSGA